MQLARDLGVVRFEREHSVERFVGLFHPAKLRVANGEDSMWVSMLRSVER